MGVGAYREAAGKEQLGRSRLRWEDNIQIDLQEVGRGSTDWIDVAQNRDSWWALVNTVVQDRVP